MPKRTQKYPPETLVNLRPVRVFTATFVDGEQYSDTRFVAVVGEGEDEQIFFLHPEKVDSKIRQPARWLKAAISGEAGTLKAESSGGGDVEVPENNVPVPMG